MPFGDLKHSEVGAVSWRRLAMLNGVHMPVANRSWLLPKTLKFL